METSRGSIQITKILNSMVYRSLLLLFISIFHSCQPTELTGPIVNKVKEFDTYWNQGKAEITSYNLYQARYGEMREGQAHIIFVTEEFSKEKQIKLENAGIPPDQKIPVLKMNLVKKFQTGIYPYSMMLSSFVHTGGVAPWQAIKLSMSSQEWCGHVYSQLNLKPNHYIYQMHSYFESENDIHKKLDRYTTEDAIWNLIRINPDALIQSDSIMIIPSLLYSRLSHKEVKPYRASTKKLELDEGNLLYHIDYPALARSLAIEYEPVFPYTIVKWTEEYMDGFGDQAKLLTTTAVRKNSIMIDYWNKHKNSDSLLLKELEFQPSNADTIFYQF